MLTFTTNFFQSNYIQGATMVSISRTQPKGFEAHFSVPELAPAYMSREELATEAGRNIYTALYQAQLNKLGIVKVRQLLAPAYKAAKACGINKVLLCCWEKAGNFCHRRILAKWIYSKTGVAIHEWSPKDDPNYNDRQKEIQGIKSHDVTCEALRIERYCGNCVHFRRGDTENQCHLIPDDAIRIEVDGFCERFHPNAEIISTDEYREYYDEVEEKYAGHFQTQDILFTENDRARGDDLFKRQKEHALLQAADLLAKRIEEWNNRPLARPAPTTVEGERIRRAERNVAEARKRELSDFDRDRIHRFRSAKELAGRLAEVLDSRETSSRGLLMNPWATRKWTTGKELVIKPASFKWAYHTNRHMTSKELDREIDHICDDIAFEREQAKA